LGYDKDVFLSEGLLPKACVARRYRDADITVPASSRYASSELLRAAFAKLAR
jgi:hypothetical protein